METPEKQNDGYLLNLSRRERQIMDILFARGRSTAAEIRTSLSDPPSYSTVRALLRILVDKGHVHFSRDGARYVYKPTVAPDRARGWALKHTLDTFCDGSMPSAVAALLDLSRDRLSDADLDELTRLVEQARRERA